MITKNINGNDISQAFIDEIRSDSPNTTARLMLDGSELSCDIVTISVQKGSCGSATFMIGSVVADMLTATVKNLSVDIKGKELEYQVGAFVNDAYEYISLGRFIVSEVKKTRYQQEITAYSNIVGKSGETLTPFLTSTPTLAQLGSKIAGQIGCLVKYDSDINTSLHITKPLDANLTVYNGIEILALCCGGYAINDNEGNIWIKRFSMSPNLSVDTGMMTRLPELAEQPYAIDSVLIQVSDATFDEEGNPVDAVFISRIIKTIETETGQYIETENQMILVAEITTDYADLELSNKYVNEAIFAENIAHIIGYKYYPATVHLTLGDPRLDGSDVLSVTDVDGTEYVVPCHQITHAYTNTVISDITSATPNNKANDIGTAMPITARLDKIERKTDASNQTADNAMKIAGNNNQYFWFTGSGTDTGAHITETPQEQFLSDPENGGGNLLARSNGVAMRDGLEELATFSQTEIRVGKSDEGNTAMVSDGIEVRDGATTLAKFGIEGARIGKINESRAVVADKSFKMFDGEGNAYVDFTDLTDDEGHLSIEQEQTRTGWYFVFRTTPYVYASVLSATLTCGEKTLEITNELITRGDINSSQSEQQYLRAYTYFSIGVYETGQSNDYYPPAGSVVVVDYTLNGTPMQKTYTADGSAYTFDAVSLSEQVPKTASAKITSVSIDGKPIYAVFPSVDNSNGVLTVGLNNDETFAPIGSTAYFKFVIGEDAKAYTLGYRKEGSTIGQFSTVIGNGLTASAPYEVALGKYNRASNSAIFSIGAGTEEVPRTVFSIENEGNNNKQVRIGGVDPYYKQYFDGIDANHGLAYEVDGTLDVLVTRLLGAIARHGFPVASYFYLENVTLTSGGGAYSANITDYLNSKLSSYQRESIFHIGVDYAPSIWTPTIHFTEINGYWYMVAPISLTFTGRIRVMHLLDEPNQYYWQPQT